MKVLNYLKKSYYLKNRKLILSGPLLLINFCDFKHLFLSTLFLDTTNRIPHILLKILFIFKILYSSKVNNDYWKKKINDNDPYVIAEIGHNHQGNLKLALKMIAAAAASGVNAVKLQKRNNKILYTKIL